MITALRVLDMVKAAKQSAKEGSLELQWKMENHDFPMTRGDPARYPETHQYAKAIVARLCEEGLTVDVGMGYFASGVACTTLSIKASW